MLSLNFKLMVMTTEAVKTEELKVESNKFKENRNGESEGRMVDRNSNSKKIEGNIRDKGSEWKRRMKGCEKENIRAFHERLA